MTHRDLVLRAERWLHNSLRCRVVFTELRANTRYGETPDVIGWVNTRSIVVECKVSRSDFLADHKKPSRHPTLQGMGHWRFYLTEPGLLDGLVIPKGWGWYVINGKQVKHTGGIKWKSCFGAAPFESCRESEVAMLLSALARQGGKPIGKQRSRT